MPALCESTSAPPSSAAAAAARAQSAALATEPTTVLTVTDFGSSAATERQGLRINVQQDKRFVVARKTQRDGTADALAGAGNHSSH